MISRMNIYYNRKTFMFLMTVVVTRIGKGAESLLQLIFWKKQSIC